MWFTELLWTWSPWSTWRCSWAWRTSTRSVTSATHTSAPACMGQARPSGVGVHLLEGEETMLQTSDPSKTREGMRRLQMGYVWELHNLVDTGRSPFIHFFLWNFFSCEIFWKLFQIWEERLHCGYSAGIHRCKLEIPKQRLKVGKAVFSRFNFSARAFHAA